MDVALVENMWAKYEDIVDLSDIDKQSLLSIALNQALDPEEHSLQELQTREIFSASGGLCGMAAMYQALHDTLLTQSQLRKMNQRQMKEAILTELNMDLMLAKTEKDYTVLEWYYEKICHHHQSSSTSIKKRDVSFIMEPSSSRQRYKRQSTEDNDISFYGNTLTYECGLARRFLDTESELLYDNRSMICNWNKTWTPAPDLDPCVWVACINPPAAPEFTNLEVDWDGVPLNFTHNISYSCSFETFFEMGRDLQDYNITCLDDGSWGTPDVWPECVTSINCSSTPPARDSGGTWEWSGSMEYGTQVQYTCGPHGQFLLDDGSLEDTLVSSCLWNKTWSPSILKPCIASSCPIIPFPPRETGLIFEPSEDNDFSLTSGFSKYNPALPVVIPFPEDACDKEEFGAMVVGKINSDAVESSVDFVFKTKYEDEAFHVAIALGYNTVYRYAAKNGTVSKVFGSAGDGTTIDLEETFTIRIACDGDGWVVQVNDERSYLHFLHIIPFEDIDRFEVSGDADIGFVGFGDRKMKPAPSLAFNITYKCPAGEVFGQDWYAVPFITMTCQDSGLFDAPDDWTPYVCQLPTTTECWDCTTTTPPPPTTTEEPTTPPPDEVLYGFTTDYHWDQFDKNVTKRNKVGDWKPDTGLGQGPFGFGKAVKFVDEQCMYDTTWMKPDVENGLDNDPCMVNPLNCTDGLSWSVWEQMQYGSDIIDPQGGNTKKYIMSTGGDYNGRSGKAWPGFALYHQGLDIVAVVSTGEKVWELRVSGQLYNNTWTEVGIRWKIPDISKPKNAETEAGREKMGGLEMYINLEKVGQSILPESTDRGSTTWKPQPVLTSDGTEDGLPVMMLGCHQNSALKEKNQFTGFAGTAEAPALFDEVAIWRRRLEAHELSYFMGGYAAEFESINADQFSAMLGNVDLADAEQAAAAQAVLQAMLMGPPTTLPPFPTRTRKPTTPMDPNDPNYVTESIGTTTSTTTLPPPDEAMLRKTMLGRQSIMTNMLKTDAVSEGQDPVEVEGRFAVSMVASAILSGGEDNQVHWDAVHQEPEHDGPMKTAKEIEEYMIAWVGSVNTTAFDPDRAQDDFDKAVDKKGQNWKTNYFDSNEDSMRYATNSEDFVLNVDKLPFDTVRQDGAVRMQYPDYSGWEWEEAKAKWENVKDNFTVPTGMYANIPGCREKPLTILTAVYNGLPKIAAKRRNPVSIKSKNFFIDSKVISVRTKVSSDPIIGDITDTYQCEPEEEYMKWNPVRMILYHSKPAKAKRTLLWHTDDYWEGLEVRHCVWWNERFGTNGAWDDSGCVITATDDEKSHCECSQFGSYAVLSEMLEAPNPDDKAIWILAIKWIGIIIGTLLLTIFIAVVFLSVVVGEMFHQLRMYCCLSYLIANLLMLIGDTSFCEDRHSNMAISMALMFFFQAAMWWNMCEAHATFKGITCGLINGRTSVYHPIAWGMPLICVGFQCFMYGELLGTHPNCFISWENIAIEKFFYYNTVCFLLTFGFTVVIVFNVMKVQSHNKETVMYLSDQVKGLVLTSVLMFLLWSYCTLGWLSYYKNPERDFPNTMPLFQIFNGWFGVILFFTLGMWSKRFRIGLNSQAEEKRRMMQEQRDKMAGKSGEKYEENADEKPLGSPVDGKSLAGTAPTSPVSSRPASAVADASRPATAAVASRPATAAKSRPATAGSTGTSRPVSAAPPQDDEEQPVPDESPEEEAPPEAIP